MKVTITVAKSVNVPAGAVLSGTCGCRSSRSCCLPSCTKRKLLLFKRFFAVHTFLVRVRRNWYIVFGWNWESTMFSYPQWKCWHVKSCLNRIGGTNSLVCFKCFPVSKLGVLQDKWCQCNRCVQYTVQHGDLCCSTLVLETGMRFFFLMHKSVCLLFF